MFKYFYLIIILFFLLLPSCKSDVGDPCTETTDCEVNLICEDSFKDGYCLKYRCNLDSEDSCPAEAQCTLFKDRNSTYCLAKCNKDEDCRESYSCKAIPNNKYRVCLPKE